MTWSGGNVCNFKPDKIAPRAIRVRRRERANFFFFSCNYFESLSRGFFSIPGRFSFFKHRLRIEVMTIVVFRERNQARRCSLGSTIPKRFYQRYRARARARCIAVYIRHVVQCRGCIVSSRWRASERASDARRWEPEKRKNATSERARRLKDNLRARELGWAPLH